MGLLVFNRKLQNGDFGDLKRECRLVPETGLKSLELDARLLLDRIDIDDAVLRGSARTPLR